MFATAAIIGAGAVSMYMDYKAGKREERASRSMEAFNAQAIQQDIRIAKQQALDKKRVVRETRAREHGGIEAAGVASGVDILRSGSVRDMLLFNAEMRAREETAVDREFMQAKKRLETEGQLRGMEGRLQRKQIRGQTTSNLLGTASSVLTAVV